LGKSCAGPSPEVKPTKPTPTGGVFPYDIVMPDSFGKRQRREVKAKKAAAREERRLARNQRRHDRAAGILDVGAPVAESREDGLDAELEAGSKQSEPERA